MHTPENKSLYKSDTKDKKSEIKRNPGVLVCLW